MYMHRSAFTLTYYVVCVELSFLVATNYAPPEPSVTHHWHIYLCVLLFAVVFHFSRWPTLLSSQSLSFYVLADISAQVSIQAK